MMFAGAPTVPKPSSLATPWALVKRGGVQPGQRPRTRIAWVTGARSADDKAWYLGYFLCSAGTRRAHWTKNAGVIQPHDIVAQWITQPTNYELSKARRSLAVTREET